MQIRTNKHRFLKVTVCNIWCSTQTDLLWLIFVQSEHKRSQAAYAYNSHCKLIALEIHPPVKFD